MVALTAEPRSRPAPHDSEYVYSRVMALSEQWSELVGQRTLTRDLLSGGVRAVKAILGEQAYKKAQSQGKDPHRLLPISNLLLKAMERQAQRIGSVPTLKVLPAKDTQSARDAAEKRELIVEWLDHESNLELQLPVFSRWTPGYGFAVWLLKQRRTPEGLSYVHAAPRDPYDCYPSEWGPDQAPKELAIRRRIPTHTFKRMFPDARAQGPTADLGRAAYVHGLDGGDWEGTSKISDAQIVWEFYDSTGTYLLWEDGRSLLRSWPNAISRPAFVVERRLTFGQLHGQWEDHIGMMSGLARMHALALIFAQDSVFTETNIIGDVLSGKYKFGRGQVNRLSPGSKIDKPVNQTNFQVFTQIDRVERLLRNAASYPVASDGEAPMSFLTGQGLDNLLGGISAEIREYNLIRKHSLQELDSKRLEWDEKAYGGRKRPLTGQIRDASYSLEYDPSEVIGGNWRTTRKFGAMAGFDEPQKIVAGLQLLTAEVLDPETLAEELDGVDNYQRIRERLTESKSLDRLYDVLTERASAGDSQAMMALVDLARNPSKLRETLSKYFTPDEPQLTPEEQAAAAGGIPGGGGGEQADLQTILSRLTLSGQPQGGAQTVATRGG